MNDFHNFNKTIKCHPRNFSSSNVLCQREVGVAPDADPSQPDYNDLYHKELKISCKNKLIGDLGQTKSLYFNNGGKIPCISTALRDKYKRLSAAYSTKLASTLGTLNPPVISE